MSNSPDRCTKLRTLHARLTNEVKILRENIQRAEQDGIHPSIEALNKIKTLQASLHTVSQQLQNCPPEQSIPAAVEVSTSSLLKQVKSSLPAQRVRQWFPDSEQHDEDLDL
ncbi:MAG: hypothetical protein E6J34_04825 [Chloroflexi bacterium]|nr:MAG: hypothetical protein E6J34_04825 [Chloroflexota bacterium]